MRSSGRSWPALVTALALLAPCWAPAAQAQPVPGNPPDTERMYQALKKARAIAGLDLYPYYAHRCILDQTYRRTLSRGVQAPGDIEPQKVFDNVYFVGQNAVSAYAVTTSAGIIVFDAMNSAEEARKYIVGGLEKLGLDPKDIRYVVITHSHGDHYGGAQHLRESYGAKLVASAVDWGVMARDRTSPPPGAPAGWRPPSQEAGDLSIQDGQEWKVGDVAFRFYVTPGHTPGTLSSVFRTTDQGRPHVVGFYGGLGTPASAQDKKTHIAQLERFQPIARAAGVDVLLANHQTQDQAIPKLEELRMRRAGDPNPYVLGQDRFIRYLQLQQACTEFAMAQQGQK